MALDAFFRRRFDLARHSDLVLAALIVGIVAMMIIPLPTFLLDVLIAANISLAVILLLVSIYITDALRIATFPSILLITTLFRLGLNVSSTRLILLQADAGAIVLNDEAVRVSGPRHAAALKGGHACDRDQIGGQNRNPKHPSTNRTAKREQNPSFY